MVHHYKGCTVCNQCRSGWSQLCQEEPVLVYGNNAHGGHAKYLKVPAFTLVPLPDEMSFVTGAAVSCGTGTAYGRAAPHPGLRQRHDRDLFGQVAGRAVGDPAGERDGRRASLPSTSAPNASNAPRSSARPRRSHPRSNDPVRLRSRT